MNENMRRNADALLSPLLNVKQVAKVLGIHERTVWRLAGLADMGEGNFPKPLRIAAKTVRWRMEDIKAYLSALAGGSGSTRRFVEDE